MCSELLSWTTPSSHLRFDSDVCALFSHSGSSLKLLPGVLFQGSGASSTVIVPGEHSGCCDLHLILLKHSDAQRQNRSCKMETGWEVLCFPPDLGAHVILGCWRPWRMNVCNGISPLILVFPCSYDKSWRYRRTSLMSTPWNCMSNFFVVIHSGFGWGNNESWLYPRRNKARKGQICWIGEIRAAWCNLWNVTGRIPVGALGSARSREFVDSSCQPFAQWGWWAASSLNKRFA